MLKNQEDSRKAHEEEMWQMSSKFHNFSCPFNAQKYESIFVQAFYAWQSKDNFSSEVKLPEPEAIQLRNKTKFNCYFFEPTSQKDITIEEYEEMRQSGTKDQELLKESRDLARILCKSFNQNDVYFTQRQIEEFLQDYKVFLKEKNTNMKGIKRILKFTARIMFIYQAYFNENFQNPQVNHELKIKYEKELEYLRRQYKEQMENVNRVHPGKIGTFSLRLLKDLSEYPITQRKFLQQEKQKSQLIKNNYLESQGFLTTNKFKNDLSDKASQDPNIKIEYQDENPFYPITYEQERLEESLKELSLQQDGLPISSSYENEDYEEKLLSDKDKQYQ